MLPVPLGGLTGARGGRGDTYAKPHFLGVGIPTGKNDQVNDDKIPVFSKSFNTRNLFFMSDYDLFKF